MGSFPRNLHINRRSLVALLAAVSASASVFGSAAGLGGINPSQRVGSDDSLVAACDTNGVGVAYTETYTATAPAGYKVSAVTITGVADACDGQNVSVTLANTSDASIGAGTLAIPTSAAVDHTVTMTPAPSASLVARVHVVIAT